MKFVEAPKFLLQEFLNDLVLVEDSTFIEGLSVKVPSYFDVIVEQIDDDGLKNHFIIPFSMLSELGTDDDYLYIRRRTSLETAATSAVVIVADSDLYLKKSSINLEYRTDIGTGVVEYAGLFDVLVRRKAELDSRYIDYVSIQKPWLYLGKIYPQGDSEINFRVDLWDLARYAISCLPPHLQTSKIKSFLRMFFDKTFNRIYNREKFVASLIDALEIDLTYIDYLADLYGITLDKGFVDSIKVDLDGYTNRINERRLREYVRELPNFLKRKGTYSSMYIIFENNFWQTNNKLNVYERWHQKDVCLGWPEDPTVALPTVDNPKPVVSPAGQFIDFNYLEYYSATPSGCVSGYDTVVSGRGFNVPIENCFIHRQTIPSSTWFMIHYLNNWRLATNYNVNDVVFPDSGLSYTCILAHTASNTNEPGSGPDWPTYWAQEGLAAPISPIIQCLDDYLNVINPQEIITIDANSCALKFTEKKTGYVLLADQQYINPVATYSELQSHNIGQITPLISAYRKTLIEYNTDTISASAAISLGSVTPYGVNQVLLEHVVLEDDMYVMAMSGDYFHHQASYDSTWNIEHDLLSKAVITDYYTSEETSGWSITHLLDNKDLVYQTIDRDNAYLPHITASNPDNSLINVEFSLPNIGNILVKEADETISLPSSADWVVTYTVSAGPAPIIQVYDDSYNEEINAIVETRGSDNIAIDGPTGNIIVEVVIPDYTEVMHTDTDLWFVNHRLNSLNVITNVYSSVESSTYEITNPYHSTNIFVQTFLPQGFGSVLDTSDPDTITEDTISISLSAASRVMVNSYHESHPHSTFTHTQAIPSAVWWVEHNLDTYAINARVYSGAVEVTPDHLELYNRNWMVITFETPTDGYVDIYLSENSFIPSTKVIDPEIETIDENNILVTMPTSATGYVSCAVAGLRCANLVQSSPMHSHIVDENNITATFLPEAAGVAAVREIGQLTYGAGLVMSPHYKVEVDINCEPLTPPNIVEKHIFEHFISSLEFSRPACKYAHYSILVSPKTDFTGTQIDLYDEQFDPRVYTWCCVDTTPISGGFVYSQYTASSYWTITHNLYNWDVMVQCYDFDRELVFPAEVLVVDENTVKIAFHTPQRGFALILEASETFTNTATASGSWGVPYDLDSAGPSAAISDFYFYNREQLVPSNIEIVAVDRLESLWYVPTLGYCQLHEYNYLHLQYEGMEEWTINHNLTYDGIFIQCFDLDHNVIEPYKIKLNKYTKNCTVSFPDRNTGYAIVTAVGNSFTRDYIIESIANGGYIKAGSGTYTYTWDPRLYNMMKEEYDVQEYNEETILGGLNRETRVADVLTSTNVVLTEDVFRYYISGIIQSGTTEESFKEKDITEMALFTAEGDLVFYTYVRNPAQFYKTKLTDIKILYRIEK